MKPSTIKCFRCFQQRHKSNECPLRRQVQLLEGNFEEQEHLDSTELIEVEELRGDEGIAFVCVVERLLVAPRQSTISQRHVIFRTKCTINEKMCNLLIDNNCTKNIMSKTVVKALDLKMIKHPHPYKINWVTEMCRVMFSIVKQFSCEVLCDVINMDVCRLILGRSWQFDIGSIYKCRPNVYTLEWKGRKLKV